MVNTRWGGSIGFEEFLSEGEELAGAAVPFGDAVEAEAVVGLAGAREIFEQRGEFGEEGLAGVEPGEEALADEAGDQELEFEAGGVGGGAMGVVALNGAEGFEGAEALAGGAFADAEAVGDSVHGEGIGAGEEEAVDLAVGARVSKEVGEFGEDIDEDLLEAFDGGGGRGEGGGRGHGW